MGLKVPLLRQMCRHDTTGAFVRAFTSFAVRCANGDIPATVRPFFFGAALTGLPKVPHGVRPIAAGEILRRIIAKAVLAQIMPKAKRLFGDLQLGVGRKCGIEHTVFSCRNCTEAHTNDPDFVGLKVDMKNAFNTLLRDKMLQSAKQFPELAHWLAASYGSHSHLWFGEFVLSSQTGVQQGDPLGPLLFALTLMETIAEIERLHPLLNKWYLDDGVIFGTHETISKVIQILEGTSLSRLGLQLNAAKCELIWMKKEFARDDYFPARFSHRIYNGDFTIVGTPIGSAQFQDNHIRAVTKQAEVIWGRLAQLNDIQAAYTLFRACATWNRVAHLMRTVPPTAAAKAFSDFDERLRSAFAAVTTLMPTDHQWLQMTLPTKLGGFGLRSTRHHSPAAFAAAALFFARDTGAPLAQVGGLLEALDLVNDGILVAPLDIDDDVPEAHLLLLGRQDVCHPPGHGAPQGPSLVGRPRAGDWLNVVPAARLGTKMLSAEFIIAMKRWIGQPVDVEAHGCPKCGERCDVFGDHALQCGAGGCKSRRHNDLRDMIFKAAKAAGLNPVLEPSYLCTSEKRPAVTLEGEKRVCNDIFVIHPFAAAHLQHTRLQPGSATEHYARATKKEPFAKLPLAATHKLRPIGVDTFGGWGVEASEFITVLAKSDAARHNSGIVETTKYLFRRLNFSVIRHTQLRPPDHLPRRRPAITPIGTTHC